jgi:hypothetical protein
MPYTDTWNLYGVLRFQFNIWNRALGEGEIEVRKVIEKQN